MSTEASITAGVLATILAVIISVGSTVAGFFVRSINMRFKKIEKDVAAKQFKDLCSLEHIHVREKLDKIESAMEKSNETDTLILQTLAKLEQKVCDNGKL